MSDSRHERNYFIYLNGATMTILVLRGAVGVRKKPTKAPKMVKPKLVFT